MKKGIKNWNKVWKPSFILSKNLKRTNNSFLNQRRIALEHPFYDGENIYATNGVGMAVYPVGKIKLKKGTLGPVLPKDKIVPKVKELEIIPEKEKRICVSFNPELLMKVYRAMGSPRMLVKDKIPVVYLYIDPLKPLSSILMEAGEGDSNNAKGLFMPIRPSFEICEHNEKVREELKKRLNETPKADAKKKSAKKA